MTRAVLTLRFLGPLDVSRGDVPVALPPSKKTRALLAYLAVTGRPQRRERLCSMLWDVTDDPRGALRWSVSKLRALDDDDATRIVAGRETVGFTPAGAYLDLVEVASATAGGLHGLSAGRLEALAALFRGPFLEGLDLPEFGEFQAWCIAERERWRTLHGQILAAQIERLADDPEHAVFPARARVRLMPEDEAARAALIRLLAAAGRREEAEEHYHLGCRQLEKRGAETGALREAWRAVTARSAGPIAPATDGAQQEVRFCRAPDGVRIAYATLGTGPTLVKAANWMSHLEYDWKSPLWRHLARDLSREFTLVRYDQRGNGLSDWELGELGLDTFVGDLEAVVDAAGLERFALLGISQGSRVAIAYAVKHPERVSHLVLYGGTARGWRYRAPDEVERRMAMQVLIRQGWGKDNPAFRQIFSTLFMPGASPEQMTWFNELQRVSSSPENAARLAECAGAIDVTPLLERVRVPTLVLHGTQDAVVPFEEGRALAAGIPGARFVALESCNHLLLDDEPAWARFLSAIRDELGRPRG